MDCPACHQHNVDGARFCAKCGALLPLPSTEQPDSLVGQIVGGRYRITQILGEGGMGRVYLAEQQMGTNVRKVAVKTLQSQYTRDPQVLARFHRECGTVSELEHPNTIHFFDFGQTPDGQLYIAMEFVQGESLSDALRPGPMRPDRMLKILAQVCGSLEEAHGRGVVHRDLKPDNIILATRAGQADFVKVLDFGIAKRSEAKDQAQEQKLTQQGMVLGTPPYMSPEQFTGKELDARSDIYSLSMIAYEMLAGRLPFDAETPWQWATQHMTAEPMPFEAVPSALHAPEAMKRAILRGLSKDRAQRQANVRQFYEELASGGAGIGAASPALAAAHPGSSASTPPPRTAVNPVQGGTQPAMAAVPSQGFAPHQITPHHVAHATPAGGQTFPTSPQPKAPSPPPASGGGKGLIIGLGSAAGVLAVVGLILLTRQTRPQDDVPPPTTATGGAATPPPSTAPTASPTEKPPSTATAETADIGKPVPPPSGGVRKPPTPAASPSVPTPPPAPALTGDAACNEAKRLAENGDAGGAARVFAGCSGPGVAGARSTIQRYAPDAVKRRIFNGDCAGARAIVTSLNGIGAGTGAAAVLDGAPQCKR